MYIDLRGSLAYLWTNGERRELISFVMDPLGLDCAGASRISGSIVAWSRSWCRSGW